MRIAVRLLLFVLFTLAITATASAQIYKWKDKDGNTIVSTTPPPPEIKANTKQVGENQAKPGTKRSPSAKPGSDEVTYKRPYKDIKVIMYMTDWCPVCRRARMYLNSLGVTLVEYDVDKDPEQRKKWLQLAAPREAVPVIDVEGVIFIGLDQNSIKATVEDKRTSYRY